MAAPDTAVPSSADLARLLTTARRTTEQQGPALRGPLSVLLGLGWLQRHLLLPAVGAAIVLAVLALLPPILLGEFIDKAIPQASAAIGVAIGAGIACIALLDASCSFARRMLSAQASVRLQQAMLVPAFAAALRLPIDQRLARDQGLLGRTFEEAERLSQSATEGMIECTMAAGMIAALAVAMLFVNAPVGFAVLAVVTVLAALHLALARGLRARETIWFETRSRHWSHIVESIAYANTVRVNAAHRFAEHRFSDRLDRNLGAHLSVITLTACLDALGRLASGLIIAAIVLIGGLRVIEGDMSVGDFVLVLSVGGSLSAPVLALVKLFDDVQAATVSIDRLWTLAQAPHEAVSCSPLPARKGGARLDIDGLEFSYPDQETPVLSGFSCTFDPGERVALVGPSGIGKSTLASLIFAARTPNRGNIRLNSIPLDQIPLDELRQRIVVVPHEIDVFTGTVTDNICLDPAWTDAGAVKAAVIVAGIESDIRALPQGYETMLGQGGVDLSAGQKQRLGIARAVLRRPDILVLDESTSALDAETERRVLDALLDALPQTTIVAITHRPSVMARMDRTIEIGRR